MSSNSNLEKLYTFSRNYLGLDMTAFEKIMNFIDMMIHEHMNQKDSFYQYPYVSHVEMSYKFLCTLLHETPTCLERADNGFKFMGRDVFIRYGIEYMPFNVIISNNKNHFDIRKPHDI